MKMRFDELFEMRKLTGIKLKDYIQRQWILEGIVLQEDRNFSTYFR